MIVPACFAQNYPKVSKNGQPNPERRPRDSPLEGRFSRPRIPSARKPSARPRQSPAPLDCSNKIVSEAREPMAKAHVVLRVSSNRTAEYKARHANAVLYQLCKTRNL